ncbi:pentatricopeptide repeat-containing protein [Pyrus ussuriensis x Pyrus communis]|uniref:Pentatricopeptide repeat-containing protein n=1 Tax=Pyrus ussuriensis x Pyrus communis TaxID=2448454 RepID=A0A5N5FHP2_9ROSA|nr:pentatricopeptide repeat-containing protein [Pyrus ussuriensis x Pyrus communis]
MEDALRVLEKMSHSDTYYWNVMIRGLADNGLFREANDFYHSMQREGVRADNYTYPFVIKACGGLLSLDEGQKVHGKLSKVGLDLHVYVGNSLCAAYAKLGCIEYAERVFDERPVKDLEMQVLGMKPDRFSMIGSLNACAIECFLQPGKEIHCQVLKCMLESDSDVMVQTSLIDMYHKCGTVEYAEMLFDEICTKNVVVWNAMIRGYTQNARPLESLSCLKKMQEADKLIPDSITMINSLPSCTQLGALLEGKSIHGYAIRRGFLPDIVLETALIKKNLISWNSMISAYVQSGQNREALELFWNLLNEPLEPDAITFSSIIPAYSEVASIGERKQIHGYITNLCKMWFVEHYNYGLCNTWAWENIHRVFLQMRDNGIQPNERTIVSLLAACSVSSMVDEGWKYYDSMKRDYGIDPGIEHSGCMIDLLGRTGNLDSAKIFIDEMSLLPTARIWGNIEFAELAAEHILSLEHDNTGCYVLLANMYAEAGRWEDVERLKYHMKQSRFQKTVACSFDETKCRSCRFINQDMTHVETYMIYAILDLILRKIGEDKYVHSITKFRPLDLKRKRANSAESHGVRLAICFGLISTEIRRPVVVRKNTRICKDCHSAAKKISEITKREIIVGDSKVFHHFIDSNRSCRDFW